MDDSDDIYRWRDGAGRDRAGDPMQLLRRLNCGAGGDVNKLIDLAESGEERAPAAALALGALACQVFALGEPFSEDKGAGVTERRWRAVMEGLFEHLEKNGPRAGTTPPSPPSSAPEVCDCPPATVTASPSTSATA